jgi:phosphatidylcholine synthase
LRAILAWGVHLFTACGAVVGVAALVAIAEDDAQRAVLLMLVALTIDALDGTLARRVDGRRLDDMVDFLNYVIVPAVFLVVTGLLPHWGWTLAPVLASAYGFSQVEAKTRDDFFLGFPSYWNVVAIYAWLLEVPPAACVAIVSGFAALVLVPFKYVYPSRLRAWKRTTYAGAVLCAATAAFASLDPERGRALHLAEISLLFPAWYLALSYRLGGLHRPQA